MGMLNILECYECCAEGELAPEETEDILLTVIKEIVFSGPSRNISFASDFLPFEASVP